MTDNETFLTLLQKGSNWMESMLEFSGLGGPEGIANESCMRKDFEHFAKLYLRNVPQLSELVKPGMNDTKLKLKPKLNDILLLGKEIIRNNETELDNALLNYKRKALNCIRETKILREEMMSMKKEQEVSESDVKNSAMDVEDTSVDEIFCSAESSICGALESPPHSEVGLYNSDDFIDNRLNFLSISAEFIGLNKEKSFRCGSEGSVNVIKTLYGEFQDDSLNNFLLQSESSTPKVVGSHSYFEDLVVKELFELLTGKNFSERRRMSEDCLEVASSVESKQVKVNSDRKLVEEHFVKSEVEDNLKESHDSQKYFYFEDPAHARSKKYDLPKHLSSEGGTPRSTPTSITVHDVTDMLFSLSAVLERLPDQLKHCRLGDLNPPKSMKNAVSMLAHMSKSIDIVQISSEFDVGENEQSDFVGSVLERKLGCHSLYRASQCNIAASKSSA